MQPFINKGLQALNATLVGSYQSMSNLKSAMPEQSLEIWADVAQTSLSISRESKF